MIKKLSKTAKIVLSPDFQCMGVYSGKLFACKGAITKGL